jgi:hypothetical protein
MLAQEKTVDIAKQDAILAKQRRQKFTRSLTI